mgnify:CR=1 FL=1
MSFERKDEIKIVECQFLENAIKQFKKVKDYKKVKKLEERYNISKKSIQLIEIGERIDTTNYHTEFAIIAKEISYKHTTEIITTLMYDTSFFPTYSSLEKMFEKNKGKFFFKDLFTNTLLDVNGNTVQYFDDEDEKKYFDILQSYNFHLQLVSIPLLQHIFYECIKKNKLNTDSVLTFLNKNSWFGKELQLSVTGQRENSYNWLSLIAPALNEFFLNIEFYFLNPKISPNFILCIDSLATKIEGMIRDICEFSGIIPFEFKKDNKGRTISFQKDVHKLLYEDAIVNLISKDDLLFIKFVLIEKAGYHLRHKVAHSLMTYNEYNVGQMILLVLCVLKLGKYDLVSK